MSPRKSGIGSAARKLLPEPGWPAISAAVAVAEGRPLYHNVEPQFANRDPAAELQGYFEQESMSGRALIGQLIRSFQQRLAQYHQDVTAADCDFYHTIDLGYGDVHPGAWDLRGHEGTYLGQENLRGRRVIELGPASGWLSAYMVRQGARLVAFDLPFGKGPLLVPMHEYPLRESEGSGAQSMARVRNSWWFTKNVLGFEADAVYGDIVCLPPDIGHFDVAVFGAILLHLPHPFLALQRVAEITRDTIIVTEVDSAPGAGLPLADRDPAPTMLVAPTSGPNGLVHWWALSPAAVVRMLAVLGFTDATVSLHSPPRMAPAPPLFTVVAHRPANRVVQVVVASRPDAALAPEPQAEAPEMVDGLPVPPPHLRFLVAGTEEAESFLQLGRRGFDALTRSVQHAGVELSELGQVLDFGCGVGRVLRHWHAVPGIEMHGTDLCEEAIDWAAKNLAFARVGTNGMAPTLGHADDRFGLVYALSVFTHLPGAVQLPWFLELVRIVRPGGLLYLTTHGAYYRGLLGAGHQAEFDAGRLVVGGEEAPGSNHCAAYHPPAYMHSGLLAQASVTLLEHLPCGANGNPMQDSWLIRKNI